MFQINRIMGVLVPSFNMHKEYIRIQDRKTSISGVNFGCNENTVFFK